MILGPSGRPLPVKRTKGQLLAEGAEIRYDSSAGTALGVFDDDDDKMQALALEDQHWIGSSGEGSALFDGEVLVTSGYMANLYRTNPIARNIIRAYVTFLSGADGFDLAFEDDAQQRAWDEWAEEQRLDYQIRRAIRDAALYGASYGLTFPLRPRVPIAFGDNPEQKPAVLSGAGGPAKEQVRFWSSPRIARVVYNPEDELDAWGYLPNNIAEQALDPRDVTPFGFEEETAGRGVSVLLPVVRDLARVESFAQGRYYLNWMRARIPLIRKLHATAGLTLAQKSKPEYSTPPKPGTLVFENDAIEWVMPELHIGAADALADYRSLILRIAAGVGLPEYAVIADASNANYSSTLVAGSPAHRMFEAYQAEWRYSLARLFRSIARSGTRLGWGDEFEVRSSPVVAQDLQATSAYLTPAVQLNAVSRRSMAERLGLRWTGEDGEEARIEQELFRGFAGAAASLAAPGVGDMEGEEEDEEE